MEMTYSEPQTPLFPTHVNLVREKHHWKRGESQHNTDCLHCTDVAVGIINIYPPNFCIMYTNPAGPAQPNYWCSVAKYCY